MLFVLRRWCRHGRDGRPRSNGRHGLLLLFRPHLGSSQSRSKRGSAGAMVARAGSAYRPSSAQVRRRTLRCSRRSYRRL